LNTWTNSLKALAKLLTILAILLPAFGRTCLSQDQNPGTRFLPLAPGELLKLVPTLPKWKMTSSRASNQVSSWLLTIAQRSFEYEAAPAVTPAAPMKVSITLMDGGRQSLTGRFDNFKPGIIGNDENLIVNGCQTIVSKEANGRERLTMNIGNRLTLTAIFENQPAGTAKAWASTVDVGSMFAATRRSPSLASLPHEIQIEVVDEVNSGNNRRVVQPIRTGSK
jgi:hypothetical protein